MKPGRRVADPATKTLQGTYRKDRHADIVATATPVSSVPKAPAYLNKEARLVWDEELPRVIAMGGVDADSSVFARYCVMEAVFRGGHATGADPSAALAAELRRYAELLQIAGQRSRLAKVKTDDAAPNPFSVRPN
jgi:hypothetical protein